MKTVIIWGPPGCGKTYNAERLRAHFGCRTIVDGWDGRQPLPEGALALTVDHRVLSDPRTVRFSDVAKKLLH